jgi:pyruvate,orthophosphate dikinase
MIPLPGTKKELDYLKEDHVADADAVFAGEKTLVDYLYGHDDRWCRAPRDRRRAGQTAEFFSFGTNDLTQMTFATAATTPRVPAEYIKKEILERDPFQTIDFGGVGKLIRMASSWAGRPTRTSSAASAASTAATPSPSSSATRSA